MIKLAEAAYLNACSFEKLAMDPARKAMITALKSRAAKEAPSEFTKAYRMLTKGTTGRGSFSNIVSEADRAIGEKAMRNIADRSANARANSWIRNVKTLSKEEGRKIGLTDLAQPRFEFGFLKDPEFRTKLKDIRWANLRSRLSRKMSPTVAANFSNNLSRGASPYLTFPTRAALKADQAYANAKAGISQLFS